MSKKTISNGQYKGLPIETINCTTDGEVLTISKETLKNEYKLIERKKYVKDFKITWTAIWEKSKNPTTNQTQLW